MPLSSVVSTDDEEMISEWEQKLAAAAADAELVALQPNRCAINVSNRKFHAASDHRDFRWWSTRGCGQTAGLLDPKFEAYLAAQIRAAFCQEGMGALFHARVVAFAMPYMEIRPPFLDCVNLIWFESANGKRVVFVSWEIPRRNGLAADKHFSLIIERQPETYAPFSTFPRPESFKSVFF